MISDKPNNAGNILVIDDEDQLRKLLCRIISLEGYHVEQAATLKAAWQIIEQGKIDIVLCDVKLPDGNGVEFVKKVKVKFPGVELILLTAYGNIADGVQSIKNGALDYITKGNDNDRIIPLIAQAMSKVSAEHKSRVKINEHNPFSFSAITGESRQIREAIQLAKKIAPTSTTVLLLGETGTGKEVFANAIHFSSPRRSKRFIAINCSAFTKELLEGELFGHKAGAYTGATRDKSGLIELAEGGTLFLDEIGEMNFELQAKLLRVLENGEFIKLGDTKVSKVDVRIIAATNRDLKKEVEAGRFREDLFYRLNIFTIVLPALRERKEDIPLLAASFLNSFSKKENKPDIYIGDAAMLVLKRHSWKGNIRELRNVLERAVIVMEGNEILPAHLPYELQIQLETEQSSQLSLSSVEKAHILKILAHAKGNKTSAAEMLGIGLTTLYRKLQEYGISND